MHVGRYRTQALVGRGGMGTVWRAVAPDGSPLALKLQNAGAAATPAQRQRLETEARALLRVRHPQVVRLLDAGEHQGAPFLAFEWLEGETLEARLARGGPLDPRAAAELVLRLARGLAACHALGLLHRDLKPDNVLLRAGTGDPVLIDFGLARDLGSSSSTPGVTVAGRGMGTPGWWPPEQARGEQARIGPASDLFGLGGILFSALTGEPPVRGHSVAELLIALEQAPEPPSALRPGVPRALDEVCLRCLARDPAARPGSAEELAQALAAFLAGRRVAPRAGRGPRLVAASGALVAAAIGVGVVFAGPRRATPVGAASAPASAAQLAAPAPTAAPFDPESERLLAEARALLVDQPDVPPAGALGLLDQALLRSPGQAALHHWRGVALRRMQRLPEAEAALRRALVLDPGLVDARVVLAIVLESSGRRDQAIDELDRALAEHPENGFAYRNRGGMHLDDGRFEAAEADFSRAIALTDELDGWEGRAAVRWQRGDRRGALEDWDAALARAPDRAAARRLRAEARLAMGDPAGARADADELLRRAPDDGAALVTRAEAGLKQGRLEEAEADLDRAIGDSGALRPLRLRAEVRRLRGNAAGMVEDLNRVLALEPSDPSALAARAQTRTREGRLDEAEQDLARALAAAPEDAQALAVRGELAVARGDPVRAEADFLAALGRDPKLPGVHAQLGVLRLDRNDPRGAETAFRGAVELDPSSAPAWTNLANALGAQGRLDEALGAFERALAIAPGHPNALYGQGKARYHLGDRAGALERFTRALESAPDHAPALNNRAVVRRELGDLQGSLADLDRLLLAQPSSLDGLINRGMTRLDLGQLDGAEADLTRALELAPGLAVGWLDRGLVRSKKPDPRGAAADLERFLALDPGHAQAEAARKLLAEQRALLEARR